MDSIVAATVFLLSLVFLYKLLLAVVATKKHKKNLPPSPPSLPIVGHLHLLKKPVHRALTKLASLHGSVLFLRFGSRPVLLVSSASAAEECFTTNDVVFANRPGLTVVKYTGANLIWSSYGSHWRNLRRISAVEIFSSHRIQSFSGIRKEELKHFVSRLQQDCGRQDSKKVELRTMIFELVFKMMMRIVTGKRYCGDDVRNIEEMKKFKRTVEDIVSLSGDSLVLDCLPWFRWMDLKGMEKKLAEWKRSRDAFLQAVIDERRGKRTSRRRQDDGVGERKEKGRTTDILDVLLDQPEYDHNDDIIRGILTDILLAGTDTTMMTIEWAMCLLLNHPEAMKRAREEIDSRAGSGKMMDELDVPHVPYLHGIIKETLRLYPTAPLLVPHESSEDTVVGGYDIPRGTMLLVNVWAIQRDEKVWEDAAKFVPERFLPAEAGHVVPEGCKFFPFGFGRRRCPGEGMAMNQLGLVLGTLIQCFHWEKVEGIEVDMTEGEEGGLALPKAVPLHVICKTRQEMLPFLS